jgi:hypothetical protein
LVVHTGNPSYLGDGGRRIGLKPAWAKSWWDSHLNQWKMYVIPARQEV